MTPSTLLIHAYVDEAEQVHTQETLPQSPLEPPIIFLHAFPLHSAMWNGQVETVQAAGFMPLLLDAPGFGHSSLSSRVSDMETLADNAFKLWQGLELEPAVVVGLSMGGYAALRLAQRHPEMLRALVLADTKAGADSDEARENRYKTAEKVLKEGNEVLLEMLPKLLHKPERAPQVQEMLREAQPEAVAAALRGMAIRPEGKRFLSEIEVPTLVIVGEEDTLTTPEVAQELADGIGGAKLESIPDASHLSNLEQPETFNRVLTNFLRSF